MGQKYSSHPERKSMPNYPFGSDQLTFEKLRENLHLQKGTFLSQNGSNLFPFFKLQENKKFQAIVLHQLKKNQNKCSSEWRIVVKNALQNYRVSNSNKLQDYLILDFSNQLSSSNIFSINNKNFSKQKQENSLAIDCESDENNNNELNLDISAIGKLNDTNFLDEDLNEHPHLKKFVSDSASCDSSSSILENMKNNTIIFDKCKNEENRDQIIYFKVISNHLEKYIRSKKTMIGYIYLTFKTYILNKYDIIVSDAHSGKKISKEIELITQELVNEIQSFISFLVETVLDYFSLKNIEKPTSFLKNGSSFSNRQSMTLNSRVFIKKELLEWFLTSMLFDEELYCVVFEVFRIMEKPKEGKFIQNLKTIEDLGPESFGVDDVFCLNELTLYNDQKNKTPPKPSFEKTPNKSPLLINKLKLQNQTDNSNRTPNKISIQIDYTPRKVVGEKSPSSSKFPIPFKKSIEKLNFIHFTKSPFHKMKLLLDVSETIHEEIAKFYEKYKGRPAIIHPSEEQFISILLYIISKCHVASILTHCQLILKFLPKQISFRSAGYFLNQILECINTIYKLVPDESQKSKSDVIIEEVNYLAQSDISFDLDNLRTNFQQSIKDALQQFKDSTNHLNKQGSQFKQNY